MPKRRQSSRSISSPSAAYATLFAWLTGLALLSTLDTIFQVPETGGRAVTLQEIARELACGFSRLR